MKQREKDIVLLHRFAETGDAEAFSDIVGRYQDFVYGACMRVLGNAADAEDAAQECFLRLARQAGSVKSSLAGWLHHHATAESIDEKNRQAARRRREEVHNRMKASSNNEATWEDISPHVDTALDELPDELRVILIEHFLGRRTQAEIAAELGVSPATMSRRVESGVEELRKKLKKAGLIVSAALLASLIAEHAVSAAPAALTVALGKLAMAGAVKTTAVTGAGAGWTGAGEAAGAVTGVAKAKIIAVAVAAVLAVGGFVAHKVANKKGPPPAAKENSQGAEKEAEEGLLSVMPEGALGWGWVSSIEETKAKLSIISEELGDDAFDGFEKMGLPEEALRRPCAVILWPTLAARGPNYSAVVRNMIVLVEVEEADGYLGKLPQPDADGIHPTVLPRFSRPDPGPPSAEEAPPVAPEGPGKPFFMKYRGYLAIGATKECLKALAASEPCELNDEAKEIMRGWQAFAHINVQRFVDLALQAYPEIADKLSLWEYAVKEFKSADLALRFDEEGVMLKTLVEAREGSALAKYLVPSDGLDISDLLAVRGGVPVKARLQQLEPPLPDMGGFRLAAWFKHGGLLETLIDDSERLARVGLQAAGIEGQKAELVAQSIQEFAESHKGFFTGRLAALVGSKGGLTALVAGLATPGEFHSRIAKSAAIATKTANEIQSAFLGRPTPVKVLYSYEPDAKTIAGTQAGRIATRIVDIRSGEIPGETYDQPRVDCWVAAPGNKMIVTSSLYDNAMEKTLAVLQGKPNAPALNDDPMVSTLASKIGLDNNLIMILSPDLTRRIRRSFGNPPLPDTYAAVGLKVPKPGTLRCDVYMPSTEKIELGLRLKAGDSYDINEVTDQEITQIINDQEQVRWQQVSMMMGMEVKGVDEQGTASVDFTIKRVGLVVTPEAGPAIEYDSDNPPEEMPLRATALAALAAMVGQSYSATFTRDGRGGNVQGIEELSRAMTDAISEVGPRSREEMVDEMQRRCAALKQRIERLFDRHPARPVGIGDSWTKRYELTAPMPMIADTTYTLMGRKDGIADIEAKSEIAIDPEAGPIRTGPAEITLTPVGPVRTKLAIDEKTGLIVRSESQKAFEGTIITDGPPGEPEKMVIPTRSNTVTTFELLKANE